MYRIDIFQKMVDWIVEHYPKAVIIPESFDCFMGDWELHFKPDKEHNERPYVLQFNGVGKYRIVAEFEST